MRKYLMMTTTLNRTPDGVGSDPASILYPSAGAEPTGQAAVTPAAPAGGTPPAASEPAAPAEPKPAAPAEPAAPKAEEPKVEWKEYEPDEAKTEEENAAAKAEHDKTKPPADPLDAVPEDGKYQVTVPDGMTIDVEMLEAVGEEFKNLGLTHKQAQALTDKYAGIIAQRDEAIITEHNKAVAGWLEDAKKDPAIGGEKWAQTEKNSVSFITKHGTPALQELLETSGYGNHPEVIRIMAIAGSMIADDDPATGQPMQAKAQDVVDVLYPNNRKG